MPSRHYFKTYFALTFFGVVLAIGGYFCWWVWLFQPPVPAGNDPITHLEMIQNFLGNPLLAIKRSQYPVGFHALIAVLSKVFHVKPITMLTSGAPFWLMLPVVSTVLVAKKLFDYRVGYLTLVLSVVLIPFPYLYVGAFPTILVNQTALPLLICWVYYTYVLKEFSKIKLIWHTIAIAIFASYLSLSHYNALAYFYLAMFWLTMLAWARPKLRPRVKYLLIIITAVFGVNLLAYAVNPSLTIAKLVRTLAGQSISASSDQYFLGQADYFAYSHLSLLTQESLAKPNNNVANFLSVPITYLFYACLICAVLLLTRKKIPSPYLPPYLLIGFLSVVYFGVAILPFTPYGGRILLDAMPWFLLFVASTIIFTIPVVLEAFLKPRFYGIGGALEHHFGGGNFTEWIYVCYARFIYYIQTGKCRCRFIRSRWPGPQEFTAIYKQPVPKRSHYS